MLHASLARRRGDEEEGFDAMWPASPVAEAGGRQPGSRYADRSLPWSTRVWSACGVGMVFLLILVAATFTSHVHVARQALPSISVFNVAPPAAPPEPQPEPVRDIRAAPEETEQKVQAVTPEQPVASPPLITLPAAPQSPHAEPVPDPAPPVRATTAPESRPTSPAPAQSTDKSNWEGRVLAALNKVKHYPRAAMARRQQGVPFIRFVLDRDGRVVSARLERGSGSSLLDDEAVSLPGRAAPLPKPPEHVKGDRIELIVPVEFLVR